MEGVIEGKDLKGSVREEVDVCVIGSGAGGAVMAKELAEKGAKVLVLEEGGAFFKDTYPKTIKDCFMKLYRNQGMDSTVGIPAVIVPTGKCLGGTTVINMGTCFRLPPTTHKKWEDLGIKGYSAEDLAPYYDQVEKLMSIHQIPANVMGKNAEMIAEGARRMGLHPKPLNHNINENCKGCGTCSYGCREDAKQAMTLNFIPWAIKHGAKFYCDCKAEHILHDQGRVLGVQGSVRDRDTGMFRHHIEIAADLVILAAGAVNTPVILLKNNICNASGEVGKNLKLHLCGRVIGFFDEIIDGHHGVGQSLGVDDFKELGIMLEATFTGPASELPGFPGFGKEFWDLAKDFRKIVSLGVMVSDTSKGKVTVGVDGEAMMTYNMNQADTETIRKSMLISARILFAAGAKKVITSTSCFPIINSPTDVERFSDKKVHPGDFNTMAFHPMGTCCMGTQKKKSVVDLNLESWEIKNLFITDASVFPTSLGVNPQETIWAFAEKCATHISKNVL
jgi:choline dehydrogenase-like flavoprotein